tara:strand:- start:317 stop:994 length:678 start_codon:yes stop_codon:yes gene_type:complete
MFLSHKNKIMLFWIESTLLAFALLTSNNPNSSLKEASYADKKNSLRIYGGYESRPLMSFVLLGDVRREYHHTSIKGFDFSRKIKNDYNNHPIDLSLRFSLIRYNEMSFQADHNQANIFLMTHYKTSYKNVPIRFFVGEGISVSGKVPFVEGRETRRLSGRDSKIMNFLNIGFDFRLSDLTGRDSLRNIRLGLADSHRSGVFRKLKWFNNTQGGSDFVTFFLEYDF